MLLAITIKNIVLVNQADVFFNPGFSVLTGETGAGKSVILNSIGLAVGKKAETSLVRHGCEQGSIVCEFENNKATEKVLEKYAIEIEDSILLKRVLFKNGSSKAFLNNVPVNNKILQEIGDVLVEIHGQHDQRGLLNKKNHLKILDEYAGDDKFRSEVGKKFCALKEKQKDLSVLLEENKKVEDQQDYITFVYEEIKKLSPKEGEENDLAQKRQRMMQFSNIFESVKEAITTLETKHNVQSAISAAERMILKILQKLDGDKELNKILNSLDKANIEIAEALANLENFIEGNDSDPELLDEIEKRLFALREIARKYRKHPDELVEYADELKIKLDNFKNQEHKIIQFEKEIITLKQEYLEVAKELSKKRQAAAESLKVHLERELKPLKMENCNFIVDFAEVEEEKYSVDGIDKVEFLVRTNKNSSLEPLQKIASGGELSRFMLAIKLVLSKSATDLIIFDEIDTGIGGKVADAVGKRLKNLAKNNVQVICITHQPQIASYSDNHFCIYKGVSDSDTITEIKSLDKTETVHEIARMLAGEKVTEEAVSNAKKMILATK